MLRTLYFKFVFIKRSFSGMFKLVSSKNKFLKRIFLDQLYQFGVLSFPMVCLVSFFTGMVMTLQVVPELKKFGAEGIIGGVVGLSISRELSPIIISIMLAGRMGSSMTAELGSMKITDQIAALELMAVNSTEYLVSPRILSSIIMLPILTIISNFIAMVASYVLAIYYFDISSGFYINNMSFMVSPLDIGGGVLKTIFFGFIIASVSCYKGLYLNGLSSEVGKATTDGVAISTILIVISNFFLSYLIFSK